MRKVTLLQHKEDVDSPKAYKLRNRIDKDKVIWVAKSQVKHISRDPWDNAGLRTVTVTISDWLADKLEL